MFFKAHVEYTKFIKLRYFVLLLLLLLFVIVVVVIRIVNYEFINIIIATIIVFILVQWSKLL